MLSGIVIIIVITAARPLASTRHQGQRLRESPGVAWLPPVLYPIDIAPVILAS